MTILSLLRRASRLLIPTAALALLLSAAPILFNAAYADDPQSPPPEKVEAATPQAQSESETGAPVAPAESASPHEPALNDAPKQSEDPKEQTEAGQDAAPTPEQSVPKKEKGDDPKPAKKKTEAARSAQSNGQDEPGNLLRSASEAAKNEDWPTALEKYKLVLDKSASADPKLVASALSGAARALQHTGQESTALEYLNKAITLNQSLKNAHSRSLDLILAGRILMGQSHYEEALKFLGEGVKLLPLSEAATMPAALQDMATCYLHLQNPGEAITHYNKVLNLLAKNGDELTAAKIHVSVGELLISKADYKGAKVSLKKAEKIFREKKLNKELGETLFRLAYIEQLSGDACSAQKSVEEGQAVVGADSEVADALPLMVKGMAAYNQGKVAQAVKCLNDSLAQYQKLDDRMMAARVRLLVANAELDRARLTSALELAGKSLEDFRSLGSPSGEAAAMQVIGAVYFRQGFVQKSQEYAEESLALAKKVNDKSQLLQSAILLSDLYTGLGNLEAAAKTLKEAVDESKALPNKGSRAQLKLAIARFRLSRESLDKALQDTVEARKDFVEISDKRGVADSDHIMGLIYEMKGDREKALSFLEQALASHTELWDRFAEGKDLTALGVRYKNAGDYDKAMECFEKAQDLRKGIGDLRGYAATLANIGNLLRHRNQVPEASKNLEQALNLYRELSDRKGEADILTNLANLDASRGNQTSALEKYSSALKAHREIQDNRGIATDLVGMGKLYLVRGDLTNATDSLEEAGKVNKQINNPRGDIAIMSELAMLQRSKGAAKQALALIENALALAKKIDDGQSVSALNLKMATLLEDTGDYPKAMTLLKETLNTMRSRGDKKGELWALGGIGIIQVKMEDYENALGNLQAALDLRSELGIPAAQSRDLDFYIGEIHEGFRDYERALDHYQKALAESQSPGNDGSAGRIYDRMGDIYYRMEEYSKAKDFYEDALRVHSETRDTTRQKVELVRLGDILGKLGDTKGAEKLLTDRALPLATDTKDQRMQARVLSRIGTLHQIEGEPSKAIASYEEALEIRTSTGDKRGVSENLLQIALVTSNLGKFDSAVTDLKKAFEIAHCSEDRGMLWKAYFIMGRALENKNKLGEALESYRKAISVLESMEADISEDSDEDDFIFGGRSALFDTALRVLMKLAKKDPEGAYDNQALRIVEKLKASEFENTLSRINVDHFSDLPQELLVKEKSLKLALRKLNSRISEELSKVNPDQGQIQRLLQDRKAKEKAFAVLKEKLIKEYPSYADLRYPRHLSIPQLQKTVIDPDEAVLEYMVTRSKTYIFAMDKRRFYTFSVDYAGKELEHDVDALTRPLQRAENLASWDPSLAYRLYSKIIHPIEPFLIGKKAVVVIPHGPLSLLPFEILVDSKAHAAKRFWSANDKPEYLLEKYAFCYAPSMSALSQIRTREHKNRPGWNLVAFGDAIYQDPEKKKELNPGAEKIVASLTTSSKTNRGTELKPLPGARKEITEIVKIVGGPTQTYFGADATETLFKTVDLSRYNYIHLATHGVLLSGTGKLQQQPAIVFSLYGDRDNDGFLQMGEVFGLRLNSDLVALSSCLIPTKANAGETSGLFGLARAFLFAGSESIMLSMWQVNDENAARLFVDVYRNMKEFSKAEALQKAKLTFLNNSTTSHPYYWAPFVLVGNWTQRFNPATNNPTAEEMRFKGISSWRKLLSM
jgi:tetratricopeptide (TPR) repeat protein